MNYKYLFSPNKINLANISSYSAKLSSAVEQKICEFSEIAAETADFIKEMLGEGLNLYEIFSMLGDSLILQEAFEFNGNLSDNLPTLRNFLKASDSFDKAVFSELLLEYLALKVSPVSL